ncbi:NB-ARC domain-containing protein [Streptomyces sp. NPDC059618]|uniref:NB-ARC domain-containing protein n=1 Tax=Streptomyces sp. NPDC059618 TaxID=3346887 RepID=UPI0036A1D16E
MSFDGGNAGLRDEEFASWVRSRRAAALLTQEELATRAAVSVRTIRNLEAGRAGRPHTRRLVVTALADLPPQTPPALAPKAVPAQLLPDVAAFTGRDDELRHLDAHLAAATAICLLTGPAGVGKTALAVHWGHRVRDAFPDGQFYADLRGSVPGASPAATDVLAAFLRALGVPGDDIPQAPDERAARYRTLLAGRRMLVVLDDIASADQIRPLLPGTARCPVLATGRGRLTDLVVRHGAHRIGLGPLPPGDAVRLLRTLLGDRAGADGHDATALAERCGRLPLPLRAAAEAALTHPALPLSAVDARLAAADARGTGPQE